jgi:hypothetical protein
MFGLNVFDLDFHHVFLFMCDEHRTKNNCTGQHLNNTEILLRPNLISGMVAA